MCIFSLLVILRLINGCRGVSPSLVKFPIYFQLSFSLAATDTI